MTTSVHVFCEIENTLTDEIIQAFRTYWSQYEKILHDEIQAEAFEFDEKKVAKIQADYDEQAKALAQLCLTKIIGELKIITTVNGERI